MFTTYTFQDWQKTPTTDFLLQVIRTYKGSDDFKLARTATGYYRTDDTEIRNKVILRGKAITVEVDGIERNTFTNEPIPGTRVASNFFYRFIQQEANFLLGNGVTLDELDTKQKLGPGFDTILSMIGHKALVQAVCWGFWNMDHLEEIDAYTDDLSGAVALLDERTSEPGVFIQFWQLDIRRPMYVRLFEPDGITVYKVADGKVETDTEKQPYIRTIARDAIGEREVGQQNYGGILPVVPLFGNNEQRSELTESIKSKIDLYDRIASDFGDNLEMANDVYWVLNNFGGNDKEIGAMLTRIHELKAVVNISDGTGTNSTAEPHTFEVPYNARQTALNLLEKQLYSDAMALNMDELTGGSLTNVAIEAAMTNLNLKADAFEWQCFRFVQQILRIQGIETEEIKFKRRSLVNQKEVIESIYLMRADIDQRTALKLNPMIDQDEIDSIIENMEAERVSGMPSVEDLQDEIDREEEQAEE